ncbi:MAG: TlyA family RNA methyltransferase [Magnetococcales bacterium]|nr:TlyA family RNA methyltransferase [Magnetococcales bacterium]
MKKRLDLYLLDNGLVPTIEKARGLIMSGQVLVDDRPVDKPGSSVGKSANVRIKGDKGKKWVSRGGFKLDHAITHWKIDLNNKICLDVGASTGGFTDVMLTHGAKRVYALDVGYGILDWKLVSDSRVVVMDRCNIRNLTPDQIPEPIDFITTDVSFISLKKALPPALSTLKPDGHGISLIKPQFELPQKDIPQGGVVKDRDMQIQAVDSILKQSKDWRVQTIGTTPSPITGPKGNREFLFYYKNSRS